MTRLATGSFICGEVNCEFEWLLYQTITRSLNIMYVCVCVCIHKSSSVLFLLLVVMMLMMWLWWLWWLWILFSISLLDGLFLIFCSLSCVCHIGRSMVSYSDCSHTMFARVLFGPRVLLIGYMYVRTMATAYTHTLMTATHRPSSTFTSLCLFLSFHPHSIHLSIHIHTYIHSVCVCITHTHKHWTLIHVHYPLLCSSISIRSCWLMAKSSSSSISSSTSELPRKKSHSLNVRLSLSVRTVYIFIYLYIHTHSLTQLPAARAFNTHIYVCSMVHGSLPLFPVVVFWPSWTLDLATPVAYVCLA